MQGCRSVSESDAHRGAGAQWLSACGYPSGPDQVLLTNGGSHGFSAALTALTRTGDTVSSGGISPGLLVSGRSLLGLKQLGLKAVRHGILPEALAEACLASGAKVLCLLPSLENPVPGMMPVGRRRELVLYIIEADPLGPGAEDRPPPLSRLLPERSICTCLMPGLHAWPYQTICFCL